MRPLAPARGTEASLHAPVFGTRPRLGVSFSVDIDPQ
jgi:hypothetical protein